MKQKIGFNLGIYLEGLRQLRVTGFISVICMLGITIIRIIGELPMSQYDGYEYSGANNYTGVEWMAWLILTFVAITPLLMLQMFQFMNKRNASDFYHALPHTRSTIFLSMFASVMTWVVISILATVIPSLIGAAIFSKYFSLIYDTFFLFILCCLAASVLVAGAIAIAKGLSGTILNSIILTAIILFLPRLLMSLLISAIEMNPVFDGTISNAFTSSSLNPVTGIVFSLFGIDYSISPEELLISVPSIVYGFVLGLIYLVIGLILFVVRKSETASQSATSKKMQAVYRILIATAMCVPAVTNIFDSFTLHKDQDMYWYGMVICYLIVIFVYFLYELLTTKRLRNLVRAIPGLGLVAVFNVVMYFGISAYYNSAMEFRPAPDEINSVKVMPLSYDRYDSLQYYDYVLSEVDGIVLTNPAVIEGVSETLNNNLNAIDKSLGSFYNTLYNSGNNIYDAVTFEIDTNGKTERRNLYMNEKTMLDVNSAICSSRDFKNVWLNPPDISDMDYIHVYSEEYGSGYMNEGTAEELYAMFRNEVKNADFQKWFDHYVMNDPTSMNFEVQYLSAGKTFYVYIPVYEDIAPDTYAKYMEIYEETQIQHLREIEEYLDLLDNSGADFHGDIYVDVFPADNSDYSSAELVSHGWEISSTDFIRELLALRTGDLILSEKDEYVLEISFNVYNITDEDIDSLGFYITVPVNSEAVDKINEVIAEYDEYQYY